MTETRPFVSTCTKRDLARRRSHSRFGMAMARIDHPLATATMFVVVCLGAFIAGHGGL